MTDDISSLPLKIGRYTIDGAYSRGGMSSIYLATDPVSHDQIVIKVLLPKFLSDPTLVQQFLNEGHIIAMADHPNIVKLYEYGHWEGGIYIAMELIQGLSLRRMVQKTPLPLREALDVLLQICRAIQHLHSHGIIHGDLKPENILITDRHEVKVIDFGISKILKTSSAHEAESRVIGTPVYMSPETHENHRNVSVQSDIYSLGVIAYELILGRITHGRILLGLAPRGLQDFLQKALQPRPEDRFKSIEEVISILQQYAQSESIRKDRQGMDYFLEFFAELDGEQKRLLTKLSQTDDSSIHIIRAHRIDLPALYFRVMDISSKKGVVIAKGKKRGGLGLLDTFRLHTLFEAALSSSSTKSIEAHVSTIFETAKAQDISFQYSLLVLDPENHQFSWDTTGWGQVVLFNAEKAQNAEKKGTYEPNTHFLMLGSPSSTRTTDILSEVYTSTRALTNEKRTHYLFQKLRLSEECLVDDQLACLVSVVAT